MELISREELKKKIEDADEFRLIMALQRWAFDALHIPGSLHFDTPEEYQANLDREDEIVVYCSDAACVGSKYAYRALVDAGYQHVRRYEGGLSDWQAAGYPLEGSAA